MNSALNPIGADGQTPRIPKSVFVTGANGFIGRALMTRYRALGCEVRGMDLRADREWNVVAGDLTAPATWSGHAGGCELFINTAAVVSLAADWPTYRDVSVQGVRNALDAAIAGGAHRFVQYSSIAALGWDYPDGADEKTPVVIGDEYRYGVAKGASEHVVLAAHAAGEISCTIIRPGDVYGPGSRAWISEPLKMAQAGQLILPNGGQGLFTPVYIDDLLDGTMLAAGLTEGAGQIFILWGGEKISCREFFARHWHWAGRKGYPPSLPLPIALQLTRALWHLNRRLGRANEATPDAMLMFSRKGGFNGNKARRLLGFAPKVKLDEGFRRSELWLKETGVLSSVKA
ncbi:NAD-dependent epimerase/dehydratase family protein [Sinimarinibacterium sp. CAU 1509]|uniref:NAD-dependent epimerase/dehydratase family protein n=1 Tax=Sinimarinibacterium sp. CAU 1509 TaxID=2562283 RepID=UPI0010AC83DA|nr:NAD-dependent epimerase/dehydratase family protein [Sinimarinibacterium sp. CAU 1509]TJY62273.1 NAD-dependent epimerase/dehydratase family protein [Sinimarinibacterium sp. CAU 1509]